MAYLRYPFQFQARRQTMKGKETLTDSCLHHLLLFPFSRHIPTTFSYGIRERAPGERRGGVMPRLLEGGVLEFQLRICIAFPLWRYMNKPCRWHLPFQRGC